MPNVKCQIPQIENEANFNFKLQSITKIVSLVQYGLWGSKTYNASSSPIIVSFPNRIHHDYTAESCFAQQIDAMQYNAISSTQIKSTQMNLPPNVACLRTLHYSNGIVLRNDDWRRSHRQNPLPRSRRNLHRRNSWLLSIYLSISGCCCDCCRCCRSRRCMVKRCSCSPSLYLYSQSRIEDWSLA